MQTGYMWDILHIDVYQLSSVDEIMRVLMYINPRMFDTRALLADYTWDIRISLYVGCVVPGKFSK